MPRRAPCGTLGQAQPQVSLVTDRMNSRAERASWLTGQYGGFYMGYIKKGLSWAEFFYRRAGLYMWPESVVRMLVEGRPVDSSSGDADASRTLAGSSAALPRHHALLAAPPNPPTCGPEPRVTSGGRLPFFWHRARSLARRRCLQAAATEVRPVRVLVRICLVPTTTYK